MKKAIVNVVFKDGQVMPLQVELKESEAYTVYCAFDGLESIMHKIDEINFIRVI